MKRSRITKSPTVLLRIFSKSLPNVPKLATWPEIPYCFFLFLMALQLMVKPNILNTLLLHHSTVGRLARNIRGSMIDSIETIINLVWGSIYKHVKMVLPPPLLSPPLHYLIGLEAKDLPHSKMVVL